MENFEKQDNEGAGRKAFPIKNFSDSDLPLNRLTISPSDTDLRIIGFRVQLDDDQVYSFTLDKARSKSADILSILSGSNEPTEYHQVENETGGSSCIPKGWEMTSDSLATSLKNEENEDRLKCSPALELKIGSDYLENKSFEVHIKSKNDPVCSSLIKDQQCLVEEYQENDELVDVIKISPNRGGSHYVRYFKQSVEMPSKCIAETKSKKVQTEREISATAQVKNLKITHSKSVEDTDNKLQCSFEISPKPEEQTIESPEFESNHIFTKQTVAQKEKSSQTEIVTIFSKEENCDASTQTKQTENVSTLTDFNTKLAGEDHIDEKPTDIENLPFAPIMIAKEEKAEHQAAENCQCLCGHKKQHDCIYLCCYHSDCENIVPTNILLGQNPDYLASSCSPSECTYCRCRLNRCCSETTKNCTEKLKSDIHMQYCCKCGRNSTNVKNVSTSISKVEKDINPESIELTPTSFNSLASKEKISHIHQLEIAKSLESITEKKKAHVAVKVSRSPKIEKVRSLDLPLVIQYCLDSYTSSNLGKSRIVINPVDIKLNEKEIPGNNTEEQLKSNVESVADKIKGSRSSIFNEVQKKSVIDNSTLSSKLDSYYSHSKMCPCSACHSSKIVQNKKTCIRLNSSSGVLSIGTNESSPKDFRSTSPKIKPDEFDYISKEGWEPYSFKRDEFISKKIEATDIIHLQKSCDKERFERVIQSLNDACEIVNDHLLSLRPFDENKIRKAAEILHKRWFEEVGSKYSDVLEVRNYIQYFKEFSNNLLKTLLHSVDNNGNNVLHFAFANSRFDLVDEFLQNGFTLDLLSKENKSGNTPLMICAISQPGKHSDWTVIHKCFEFSDVNKKSVKNGQTPLMNAASRGFQAMVDLLLDIGADPNLQDMDGSTALMYAAEHGHEKCVKSLVRHKKCDPTIRDKDGETACSIALSNGHKNIAVLIHMQALEKRRLSKNLYSTKRFIWTNNNKRSREKTLAMLSRSTATDLTCNASN